MKFKCISLHEPYASAVALGLKPIETRSRPTNYRGTLAIHAARKWTRKQRDLHDLMREMLLRYDRAFRKYVWPFGEVIALADLYDCVPVEEIRDNLDPLIFELGDFRSGRYAWMLANIRKLPHPVPAIGRQGFFNVEIDMIAQDGGVY